MPISVVTVFFLYLVSSAVTKANVTISVASVFIDNENDTTFSGQTDWQGSLALGDVGVNDVLLVNKNIDIGYTWFVEKTVDVSTNKVCCDLLLLDV